MSVTIQGNTSTVISNNSAPEGTSEIAKITRQIQVLTEKLGKISSEEGMTTQQKKEMAALVQKQIESLWAQLEQLLRQQAEKKNEDATVQPDKKEEKKDDTNTAGTIDIYVSVTAVLWPSSGHFSPSAFSLKTYYLCIISDS
ncbi:flxA-like family protein [Escherichia coli BCE011_MS-01]|nr:flxA-like family protein [Escherichia coli BCE011_MS-01]